MISGRISQGEFAIASVVFALIKKKICPIRQKCHHSGYKCLPHRFISSLQVEASSAKAERFGDEIITLRNVIRTGRDVIATGNKGISAGKKCH